MRIVIRRYEVILGSIFFLLFCTFSLTSREKEISDLDSKLPYRVALTFDDGPHRFFTKSIIGILKKEDVVASFFLVGQQMKKYPDLVKQIFAEGHELGSHTYFDRRLTEISKEQIIKDAKIMKNIFNSIIGENYKLIRPPGGKYNQTVKKCLEELGYKLVLWDVYPNDISPEVSPQEICDYVVKNIKDGSIVLLHSGCDNTLKALPRLIRVLKSRGYRFVKVSDLIEEF